MSNSKPPKVSVIVPVYNAGGTLAACIQSIRRQTYPDIEILMIDDGSSDDSPEILRESAQADPRIIVITQQNAGVSAARNKAIERAAGTYLQFVDSDDQLLPNATERMVSAIEREKSDMVIASYLSVVGGMEQKRGLIAQNKTLPQDAFLGGLTHYPSSFYYDVLWNKLYRRDIIMNQQIRCDTNFLWGEDFGFNMQYYRHIGSVTAITEPVYRYTRRLQGLTAGFTKYVLKHPLRSMKMRFTLASSYYRLFRETGLYEKYRHRLPLYMIKYTINN